MTEDRGMYATRRLIYKSKWFNRITFTFLLRKLTAMEVNIGKYVKPESSQVMEVFGCFFCSPVMKSTIGIGKWKCSLLCLLDTRCETRALHGLI